MLKKTRNKIRIGTSPVIFATGVFLSFQPSAANTTNHSNTSTVSIPTDGTPFYSENITVTTQNPINATHVEVSLSGNGTLTPPNSTETIAVNSTGTALVNFETTSVIAQEFLTTNEDDDGSENASATIYEITHHDVQTRIEKGVVTA